MTLNEAAAIQRKQAAKVAEAMRLADLRITPVRKRRATDIFCSACGNFHDPNQHGPIEDVLGLRTLCPVCSKDVTGFTSHEHRMPGAPR